MKDVTLLLKPILHPSGSINIKVQESILLHRNAIDNCSLTCSRPFSEELLNDSFCVETCKKYLE